MLLPVFGLFALIFIFPSAGRHIFIFGAVMIVGASAGQREVKRNGKPARSMS